MIVFKDVLQKLSENGWSAYRLVKEREMGNGTISRLRAHQSVSTDTLDVICRLCDCQPVDLIEYQPDPVEQE